MLSFVQRHAAKVIGMLGGFDLVRLRGTLRRILDDFRRDLMDAEGVLDGVTDDRVALPLHLAEPARLSRFRGHLIKIAELNRESWRYIRSETDNNDEWLPNAKRQSVLQMPVRDNMIDAWARRVDRD